jgi:hypothetical protein
MWYFFVCPFPKLCPVTFPYIQDGCHELWSIEKLEIFENLLLYNHYGKNLIFFNFFIIKSIFLFAYDLRSPGYSWGLHVHAFNTHKTIYMYIYIYITNLVCYTYFHWFSNPECQHIFGKQTAYIFQSPKTIKTWTTKHYTSLNQWYNTE